MFSDHTSLSLPSVFSCSASFPPVLICSPRGDGHDMATVLHNEFSSLSPVLSSVFLTTAPTGIPTGHCAQYIQRYLANLAHPLLNSSLCPSIVSPSFTCINSRTIILGLYYLSGMTCLLMPCFNITQLCYKHPRSLLHLYFGSFVMEQENIAAIWF